MFVYKTYDQASLDSQYNNRLHVPDFADYLARWESLSRETERILPVKKDVAYGNLPGEKLDVYPSSQQQSKTLIFIHGGYWQMLDKALFHFMANGFHAYGVTTVLLTYPLAPHVSMDQIVGSCKKAIQWLFSNLRPFNGDPEQMYVAGHSAGGHLAAMLVATDWKSLNTGVPDNVLKGACFVSGLFNLLPIHLSYLNTVLKIDAEAALRNSPVNLEPHNACPLLVVVGERETTEFHDQSKELYDNWKHKEKNIQFLQLPGENHFSIVEKMIEQKGVLHTSICQLMKLHNE